MKSWGTSSTDPVSILLVSYSSKGLTALNKEAQQICADTTSDTERGSRADHTHNISQEERRGRGPGEKHMTRHKEAPAST